MLAAFTQKRHYLMLLNTVCNCISSYQMKLKRTFAFYFFLQISSVLMTCLKLTPSFIAGPVQTQGSSSSSTNSPVISTTRHSTPPKPHPQKFKPPLPPNNRIEQLIREEEGFVKSNTSKSKNSGRVSLNVSSGNKPTKKNLKKERDRKNKVRTRHPKMSVEDKESDSVIRNAMSHVASPPPSPPSLYPSPPRLTKPQRKATKREINAGESAYLIVE